MMGIDAEKQRTMMDEFTGRDHGAAGMQDPVNLKTDWFELRDARLHLKRYTKGGFPIALASTTIPSGALAVGKHGVGMLSLDAGLRGFSDRRWGRSRKR
jgi:limonene 1,2-monooxygenase